MIVASDTKLLVGHVYRASHVRHGGTVFPYAVLREATIDDWLAEYRAECGEPPADHMALVAKLGFFYEVSVD